jgi:hypothetical protein
VEDFPGLVHFIYIDRKTDQVTAPSINTGLCDEVEMDISSTHKKKLKAFVRISSFNLYLIVGLLLLF